MLSLFVIDFSQGCVIFTLLFYAFITFVYIWLTWIHFGLLQLWRVILTSSVALQCSKVVSVIAQTNMEELKATAEKTVVPTCMEKVECEEQPLKPPKVNPPSQQNANLPHQGPASYSFLKWRCDPKVDFDIWVKKKNPFLTYVAQTCIQEN